MAQNIPPKADDPKVPPKTETPSVDGKQTEPKTPVPPKMQTPPKSPEEQGTKNQKEQDGKEKSPEKQDKKNPQPPMKKASDKKSPPQKPETEKKSAKETEKSNTPQVSPPEPRAAPGSEEKAEIVFLNLSDLHPFKDHPFQVKQDEEIGALVETVKDKGVTNPIIVRPRESGGYEIVSGHRRILASELAGFSNAPCIIRNLTDEQAITQMVEDNTTQREQILPSERAKALKMQLDAIKRQGARDEDSKGQRSNETVAKRNKMTVKTVAVYQAQ